MYVSLLQSRPVFLEDSLCSVIIQKVRVLADRDGLITFLKIFSMHTTCFGGWGVGLKNPGGLAGWVWLGVSHEMLADSG